MTQMPSSLEPHQADYKSGAWDEYTIAELGWWVHLLLKRASHRVNTEKRNKDLTDASNYCDIIRAKIDAACFAVEIESPSGSDSPTATEAARDSNWPGRIVEGEQR